MKSEWVSRRLVAAYLLDRSDQYALDRWEHNPLFDAAKAVMNGDFDAAVDHGELDDAPLRARVERLRR